MLSSQSSSSVFSCAVGQKRRDAATRGARMPSATSIAPHKYLLMYFIDEICFFFSTSGSCRYWIMKSIIDFLLFIVTLCKHGFIISRHDFWRMYIWLHLFFQYFCLIR